jgi:hypothetical protein
MSNRQSEPAVTAKTKMPPLPPVFRPAARGVQLAQAKAAGPAVPAVYRPPIARPLQAKAAGPAMPPVFRPGTKMLVQAKRAVIQRALASKSLDSSQSTELNATVQWSDDTVSTYATHSDGNGHAEDNLIDALNGHGGVPRLIFISINRSPCTSTDRAGNGATTCNKVGVAGCTERLLALKLAFPACRINIQFRDLYGKSGDEEANSWLANEAMHTAGIELETHQLGGPSATQFRHTGTAKKL